MQGTTSLGKDRFFGRTLTGGTFEHSINYIQTPNTVMIGFRLTSILPAYVNGQSDPKIIIIMPGNMVQGDPNALLVKNMDGSITDPAMAGAVSRETEFEYVDKENRKLASCKDSHFCVSIKPKNQLSIRGETSNGTNDGTFMRF